jgi:ABC-type sugar transport system ATPase subunit
VATFIGSPAMNLFDATLVRDGEKAFALIGTTKLPIPSTTPLPDGAPIVFGVRPEHLVVQSSEAGTLPFLVDLIEPTGAESHIYGRFNNQPMILAMSGRSAVLPGETLRLSVPETLIHIFDKATGARIAVDIA